jgi:transcriptional regulator with XRE-family HTH domain
MLVWGSVGELVKGLREQSGLSQDEIAALTGIPVADIAALENGAADSTLKDLQRIIDATGRAMAVNVRRHLEHEEDRWIRERLHICVSRLLISTETLQRHDHRVEDLTETSYVCLGLFGAAREIVRALLLLDALGQAGLAGSNLARQAFEYVVTAMWILDNPIPRTRSVYQATNHTLRELGRLDLWWAGRLGERQDQWARAGIPEEEFAAKLPPFDQRLVGPMGDWYLRYRMLSVHSHPTLFVVEDALETGPPLRFRAEAHCNLGWLGMAACLVWGLALSLEHGYESGSAQQRSGLGYLGETEEFAELGRVLSTFTNESGLQGWRDTYARRDELSPTGDTDRGFNVE